MKTLFPIIILIGLCSCNSAKHDLEVKVGSYVTIVGTAQILPDHSDKANVPGIITGMYPVLFRGQYEVFPEDLLGKEVIVTGSFEKERAPMFIWDEKIPSSSDCAPQGIPMPPGTDLEKESVFYTIRNPQWKLNE